MAKSTSKLFQSEEPKEMKEDAMNLPEEQIEKAPEAPADDIIDVEISAIKKKKFRINGDPKKLIELNTSDMNVAQRMSIAYERLQDYMAKVTDILSVLPDEEDEVTAEQEKKITEELEAVDKKMREEVDYIFQAPISDVCTDGGSMYDPFEGAFRFEHIIESISKLYENNLEDEFFKMKKRVSAKTSKYTKKYHN